VEPSKPVLSNPALPAVAVKNSGSGQVNFQFNIKNATQVAISSEPTFTNVGWMTLQNPFTYTWPQGKNVSVLYIKFRSVDGGESQVFKVENLSTGQTNSNSISTTGSEPVVQQFADLIFTKVPSSNIFKRLQTIKFTYTYTNNSTTTQTIKVVRSFWVNNGKERKLSQVYGFRTIKPGKSFSVPVLQYLNKTLSDGNYSIRVEILDSKGKVVKARNSFDFEIKK
jgi:hypothetical protein